MCASCFVGQHIHMCWLYSPWAPLLLGPVTLNMLPTLCCVGVEPPAEYLTAFAYALQIYQVNPTTKPKTYTWFYQSSNLAAARSSAGGLALMRK